MKFRCFVFENLLKESEEFYGILAEYELREYQSTVKKSLINKRVTNYIVYFFASNNPKKKKKAY